MKLDFWNRKEKIVEGRIGPLLVPPCPPRQEYVTMLELLKSAEYFDVEVSRQLANKKLEMLKEYIDSYLKKFEEVEIPEPNQPRKP